MRINKVTVKVIFYYVIFGIVVNILVRKIVTIIPVEWLIMQYELNENIFVKNFKFIQTNLTAWMSINVVFLTNITPYKFFIIYTSSFFYLIFTLIVIGVLSTTLFNNKHNFNLNYNVKDIWNLEILIIQKITYCKNLLKKWFKF